MPLRERNRREGGGWLPCRIFSELLQWAGSRRRRGRFARGSAERAAHAAAGGARRHKSTHNRPGYAYKGSRDCKRAHRPAFPARSCGARLGRQQALRGRRRRHRRRLCRLWRGARSAVDALEVKERGLRVLRRWVPAGAFRLSVLGQLQFWPVGGCKNEQTRGRGRGKEDEERGEGVTGRRRKGGRGGGEGGRGREELADSNAVWLRNSSGNAPFASAP